jgi:hypothetical protein
VPRRPKEENLRLRALLDEAGMSNKGLARPASSFRAPVERAIAQLKTWRILFTDYRRPVETFASSFHAAIGLHFFKESFA